MTEHLAFDRLAFDPWAHESVLLPVLEGIAAAESLDRAGLDRLLKRHPKDGRGFFSSSQLIQGLRLFAPRLGGTARTEELIARLRMKPVRSLSGVAVVTVFTKPHPCPGRCVFCPSDVRMPKSYLSDEPGAQRAATHRFDPYRQALFRLQALHNNGHPLDKVELIVLGGTWSSYPESYQLWFLARCFAALNGFPDRVGEPMPPGAGPPSPLPASLGVEIDGRAPDRTYNQVVAELSRRKARGAAEEWGGWEALFAAHRRNEGAGVRCVGLSLETRPDHVSGEEVHRLRRLGCTKVQIGIQSLSDRVLELNRRGHDTAATRSALLRLRRAGFKIHAHWMPNLYGSSPAADAQDFDRLFADSAIRPDELKIYPCSLIESAELMAIYERGKWVPYSQDELLEVLTHAIAKTPPYCRLTRVIRDIPGGDIVAGNRTTNFRQVAEAELARRGVKIREIRAREIRTGDVAAEDLVLDRLEYRAGGGREIFLQWISGESRLAAFLRLHLPPLDGGEDGGIAEVRDSALLREVHVYGRVAPLGAPAGEAGEGSKGRAQHRGLGRRLIEVAAALAAGRGYRDLAVISAVGTRGYYRRLGFRDGELYQHLPPRGGTGGAAGR